MRTRMNIIIAGIPLKDTAGIRTTTVNKGIMIETITIDEWLRRIEALGEKHEII